MICFGRYWWFSSNFSDLNICWAGLQILLIKLEDSTKFIEFVIFYRLNWACFYFILTLLEFGSYFISLYLWWSYRISGAHWPSWNLWFRKPSRYWSIWLIWFTKLFSRIRTFLFIKLIIYFSILFSYVLQFLLSIIVASVEIVLSPGV